MKQIRLRVLLLCFWLAIFYNIERLINLTSINDMAYLFVLVMVILIMILPHPTRFPLWAILATSNLLFLLMKAWVGAFTGFDTVLFTIVEILAISLTAGLVYWINLALFEFESVVQSLLIGRRDKIPEPASVGEGSIYREVRRARNHHRPLSIMSVTIQEKSIQINLERMVQDVLLGMMKQYKIASLSRTLCDELEDCAVIVQNDDQFMVVLPETEEKDLPFVIERLRKQAVEQIGIQLKIGTAVLPQDGFTFEGLIDKATREMEADLEVKQYIDLEEKPLEHHLT